MGPLAAACLVRGAAVTTSVLVILAVCACGSGDDAGRTTRGAIDGGPRIAVNDARSSEPDAYPEYDAAGALIRPAGWEQWIFLGSALNLSYGSAAPPPSNTLIAVYMEPAAYRHFKEAGEFREGTMTALTTYDAGDAGPPALGGLVPTHPTGFEMSVKDSRRTPEGWGYYHFAGGPTATGDVATPFPKSECFDCHDQHAETDHVFTQYYPMLP
jgi:Cytochrome P460